MKRNSVFVAAITPLLILRGREKESNCDKKMQGVPFHQMPFIYLKQFNDFFYEKKHNIIKFGAY